MGKLDTQLVAVNAGEERFDECHRWCSHQRFIRASEVGFTFEERIPGLLLQNLRREGTSWNNVHCL